MKEPSYASSDKRIIWLDLVKFIAIFMMIAVHCTDNVTPAERSEPWYNLWGSFYGSFMRPAIPLFVMVTGALLLPVRENLSTFYGKRLTRIVVPFLIWSVLYNLFPWITGLLGLSPTVINDFFAWAEPDQSFSGALHHILMIPFNFSLLAVQMWYVYLLIGLYLYMPIFSAWVRQASVREQRFFLLLWFVSLFIPYLREYLTKDLWGTVHGMNSGFFITLRDSTVTCYWVIILSTTLLISAGADSLLSACPSLSQDIASLFWASNRLLQYPDTGGTGRTVFYLLQPERTDDDTSPVSCHAESENTIRKNQAFCRKHLTCTLGIWMSHYLFLGPCYMLVESLPIHTMLKMIVCTILLLSVTWIFVYAVRKSGNIGRWIMG